MWANANIEVLSAQARIISPHSCLKEKNAPANATNIIN